MSYAREKLAEQALNKVLKPLGTHLSHFTDENRRAAITAMVQVLDDERFSTMLKYGS